jgi:hypothetical protein
MNSLLVWIVFALFAAMLGVVGVHFSLRTLRWVALIVGLASVAYLTVYGLSHPAQKPGSLSDAFARGADSLSSALIRPLSLGHQAPTPGRIGWLVIVVLLVLGYRGLETWALRRQAPCLDVSELASDRQDDAKTAGADAQTGKQRHDWLVAELKFRLPAVEVRTPAILPGGSRPSGLASIAEATGVSGAGLAGAIIRFFGMVWPSPPTIQVRAWVERTPGHTSVDGVTRVTVSLADPRSGAGIATKTLAAENLDAAAAAVAGFVARYIFARDRTVPAWSASATDGADLAALLRARQERGDSGRRSDIFKARATQIELLAGVARGILCAGVVRYELAQLYDLTEKHFDALRLHAANREQYPRFFRGRYRLAMSLEMLAGRDSVLGQSDVTALKEALQILDRSGVTDHVADRVPDIGPADPLTWLKPYLLAAARKELQEIQRYLTWRHIVWGVFWHRDERSVLRPYWRLRHRQGFHDGVSIALLLVAVREALTPDVTDRGKLRHASRISRIVAAISGDSQDFTHVLPDFPARSTAQQLTTRLRTRRRPGQCRTPSWPAAYNLACAYSALAAHTDVKDEKSPLVEKVITSLEFAIGNPECEMERPSEWIGYDPDFRPCWKAKRFKAFLHNQRERDYPAGTGEG